MNKKEIIKQGIELYNKHYPNDKHTTAKEKTAFVNFFIDLHHLQNKKFNDLIDAHRLLKAENQFHKDCADQYKKSARVLQSKVNTYEADIDKKHKESKEAISLIQQSINDTIIN